MKASAFAAIISLATLSSVHAVGLKGLNIKNLVTFGDSYTDIVNVGDGGTAWPVYATRYANATLYPFAKSGGTCSNKLTPRPFPSVFESQIPAYLAAVENKTISPNAKETIYSLWIGTNDLGVSALLTEKPSSLVEVTTCMVNWVQTLYDNGARNFLFQNMIPLENTILYGADGYYNRFWRYARNATEWSLFMREMTTSGNALTKLMLQDLAPKLPGAHVAIFDSHSLFTDIYNNPANYLNGTAPLNVTGAVNSCVFEVDGTSPVSCTLVNGAARDSYLWWDELHPSEQADRIVAREVAQVMKGLPNKWTTWLS